MEFEYDGKKYQIETVSFKTEVTRYRAVAVHNDERVEIPGVVSDTPWGAEGLALLAVARHGEIII